MPGASASLTGIAFLQSQSLPTLLQAELLRMILAGEVEAGGKLNQLALANRLRVSRGPLREAFRALEEAGLVRSEKNRGVFVRRLTNQETSELYEIRAGLDELAGRLLAPRITDGELAELYGRIDEMDRHDRPDAFETYYPMNVGFHDRIVALTGNGKLLAMYRRLMNELHLARRRSLLVGGRLAVSNREHRAIVDALATRDPDMAARAMRQHVLTSRDRLRAVGVE